MNNAELKAIVDLVAAADGREIKLETYGAWALVIGHLDATTARDAALMAMQDETIRWIEPKHILSKVAKLMDEKDKANRKQRALDFNAEKPTPVPTCPHGLSIAKCAPCADDLASRWVCSAHGEIFIKCAICRDNQVHVGVWAKEPKLYKNADVRKARAALKLDETF